MKNVISGDELGVLVDARSAARYAGLEEPIDPVAGRIPGARNLDWAQFVSKGEFQLSEDISHIVQKHEPAVVYCGSGVTAAALYAILAEKGYDQLKLYMAVSLIGSQTQKMSWNSTAVNIRKRRMMKPKRYWRN